MGFKTAEDGHVYNDDKKHSGSHHGSVRPEKGIKSKGINSNRGFSIRLTKEVGDLPSYLGGKNSKQVALAHNSEDRNNVALMVGDRAIKFKNYNEAREIYDSLKNVKDVDEFLLKMSGNGTVSGYGYVPKENREY